jgi:hypothetical protein
MPHLLFKLNGVPEDEALEVRQLLDENRIDYYETSAGLLGISLAAIWIRDDGEIERARSLVDEYQQQRYQQAQKDYRQQLDEGRAETLLQRLLRQPIRMLLYLAIILAILYFSTVPFLTLFDK